MQISSINTSSIVQTLLGNDLELTIKLALLTNNKLVLLFVYRLLNQIKLNITNMNITIKRMNDFIPYLARTDTEIDQLLVNDLKNELQKTIPDSFDKKTSTLVTSFKELKDRSGLMGVSGIDAKQELYTCLDALIKLETELKVNIGYLTNSRKSWLSSGIVEDVNSKIKAIVVATANSALNNIDTTSRADTAIILSVLQNLLNSTKIGDPFIELTQSNSKLKTTETLAKTVSSATTSTSVFFYGTLHGQLRTIRYPAPVGSHVYMYSTKTNYTIPASSSLFIQLYTNGLIPGPVAQGNLPTNAIAIDLTMGSYGIDNLITQINNTTFVDLAGFSQQYIIATKSDLNELVLTAMAGITKFDIMGSGVGIVVANFYTAPRNSVHTELGFSAGQTTRLDLGHLTSILAFNGFNATKEENIIITDTQDITFNTGLATDIGFTNSTAKAQSYYSDLIFDVGDLIEDKYVVSSSSPTFLSGGPVVDLTSFSIRSIAARDVNKLLDIKYHVGLTRIESLVNSAISSTTDYTAALTVELDYLTKVLADLFGMLTIEWQPTVEDLKKIQELSNIVEEKGGRPYLAILNSCQFDKINIDKNTLLAKIEDVGRSL